MIFPKLKLIIPNQDSSSRKNVCAVNYGVQVGARRQKGVEKGSSGGPENDMPNGILGAVTDDSQ